MPISSTDLYVMALPKAGRPREETAHFHYAPEPAHIGADATVFDGLSEYNGRVSYGRYYGSRNRWFNVYATFDPDNLSLNFESRRRLPVRLQLRRRDPIRRPRYHGVHW